MGAANVEQLGPRDAEALRALLSREAVQNLYLLGLFEEFGITPRPGRAPFAFWGRFQGRDLTAALFVGGDGGLVVPSADEPNDLAEIATFLAGQVKLRSCIGGKLAVDALVRHLCAGKPVFSRSQRLFNVSADDLGPFTNPTLRLATEQDVPELVPLAAGSVRESLDRDPLADDPEGFRARVLQRVRGKRTYLLRVGDRLIFKIDVGSRSQYGAELEGLYTIPEERRRGHATLSLGQISRHLLSSLPRLTLRVDDKDPSLAGVARKVGYAAGKLQRLVVTG
ncbi:MAG: GNAT family N-acetyltransferase [Myxococcaceae bacterium]